MSDVLNADVERFVQWCREVIEEEQPEPFATLAADGLALAAELERVRGLSEAGVSHSAEGVQPVDEPRKRASNDSPYTVIDGECGFPECKCHSAVRAGGNAADLLREWLSYTGLRRRAFDPDLNPEDDEYESGRSLIRRTDAYLAAAASSLPGTRTEEQP